MLKFLPTTPGIEDDLFSNLSLAAAVNQLPNKYKAVIALRLAGYTQKECGSLLGFTRSAVGFIQKKALAQLKELLDDADF